ncbi:MAG TPA: haloacid dehalogenase [Blastocatellia bacterium]|nr:haloacid dehalogenase [Blastocatellia bacterium]
MKLLITDLDNTLYDWVTYFANSFRAMVKDLALTLDVEEETLLDEFKAVHQHYGNSEHPFAMFELPSVRRRFPDSSREQLYSDLKSSIAAFRAGREEHLRLYAGVSDTLRAISEGGTIIVAHTEAVAIHAYYRLLKLDILKYFKHIYALEGHFEPHPNPARAAELVPPVGLIETISRNKRKPNPELLKEICRSEGVRLADACYVGDSLSRDVSMAKSAKVMAVWARYGTSYEGSLWDILVRVTHWTDEDVTREAELRNLYADTQPDFTIDSFVELLDVIGLRGSYERSALPDQAA